MTIRPIPPQTPGVADFKRVAARALDAEARQRGLDTEALRAVTHDAAALRRFFEGRPPLALVAFDTPGLQDYVFRVRRPIDIRGGSRIVAGFTELPSNGGQRVTWSLQGALAKAGVAHEAVIYAGGGGGILLVPAHKLRSPHDGTGLCAVIEALLYEATGGDLASVAVALEVWPDDLAPDELPCAEEDLSLPPLAEVLRLGAGTRYCATRTALMARLSRRRSEATGLLEEIPAADHGKRCEACDRRTAGDRERPTCCAPCGGRRRVGGRDRRESDEARTFDDVVKGTGSHAMAVIYADGANFGQLFRDVRSPDEHHALSTAVTQAFRAAMEAARQLAPQALVEVNPDVDDELRVQTAICGGDDLSMVLPAPIAMHAAEELMRVIEGHFDQAGAASRRLSSVGVGVGVAVADCHFPIHFLFEYAKELLRSAKREIRRTGARSAIDFLVLASGSPLGRSIAELREVHWRRAAADGEPALRFTQRPFTRARFEAFLEYAHALALVPPAQVFALREQVLRGWHESRSLWRYQHARAERDGWAAFREALGLRLAAVDGWLWQPDDPPHGDRWSTCYLDAVEARDLLRGAVDRPRRPRVGA